MPYIKFRLYAPIVSITAERGEIRECAVGDGYLMDELSIDDGEYFRPKKARVVFDEKYIDSKEGKIQYHPQWKNPDTGDIAPGTLQVELPLSTIVKSLIVRHPYKERPLNLCLFIDVDYKTMQYLGEDDDGEWLWNAKQATDLPARIHWLTPDMDFSPESPPPPPEPKPLSWQAEAIRNTQEQLVAATAILSNLENQVRNLKYAAIALGVAMLIYIAFHAG